MTLPIKPLPPTHWRSECAGRIMHLWFFKATGTALFAGIFFYSYFALLQSPVYPVTLMPTTWVDDHIALWPPAFYFYVSLWLYTALVPALQKSLLWLIGYGCAMGALCLTGLLFFLFFPTAVPFSPDSWPADAGLSILRKVDMSGNACPSLHVATAAFTAVCMHKLLRDMHCPPWLQVSNWVWCALIVYSTMGIKQHVMWDVAAGLVLALVFAFLYPLLERRLVDK